MVNSLYAQKLIKLERSGEIPIKVNEKLIPKGGPLSCGIYIINYAKIYEFSDTMRIRLNLPTKEEQFLNIDDIPGVVFEKVPKLKKLQIILTDSIFNPVEFFPFRWKNYEVYNDDTLAKYDKGCSLPGMYFFLWNKEDKCICIRENHQTLRVEVEAKQKSKWKTIIKNDIKGSDNKGSWYFYLSENVAMASAIPYFPGDYETDVRIKLTQGKEKRYSNTVKLKINPILFEEIPKSNLSSPN